MRIDKTLDLLNQFSLEALLIDNPSDIFYLIGQWYVPARILLKRDGACLIVDSRFFSEAKKSAPCEVLLAEKGTLQSLVKGLKKVGFDSANLSFDQATLLQKEIPIKWTAVLNPLKDLRVCKDESEIAAMRKAAGVTKAGYKAISKSLKEGVSEEEIALEFEIFCRSSGASALSFEPIIAFGENSAFPHYRASKARLRKDQIVLFDLGAVVDHYRADMTRVLFFGKREPKLERLYELVKRAHDMAASTVKPGVKVGALDSMVREFFLTEGVEKLFIHGLGHGIGIDVHEYPSLRADGMDRDLILRPGMVFTIEPGLYLPGLGGIRYENTFAVTKEGCENFYDDI
jgi:Xaa-Pro aminopeptidase